MTDIKSQAYWLWLRKYLAETNRLNCGVIRTARLSLFLALEEVAVRSGKSSSCLAQLEKRELHGNATLKTVSEIAEAMECEFVYAIVPKEHSTFADRVWERIWPQALEDLRVKNAQPEKRAQVLAAVAKELMLSAKFRRKKGWSRRS